MQLLCNCCKILFVHDVFNGMLKMYTSTEKICIRGKSLVGIILISYKSSKINTLKISR